MSIFMKLPVKEQAVWDNISFGLRVSSPKFSTDVNDTCVVCNQCVLWPGSGSS